MTGEGIVTRLTNVTPIPGADRIVSAEVCGETVIVSIENKEGDLGILFDCETQLSQEFASENNLFRTKLKNKNDIAGYLDDNGRVRPIKLKGVKCSGLWLPTSCVSYINSIDITTMEGAQFKVLNGRPICDKYVSRATLSSGKNRGPKAPKRIVVNNFYEHVDSDQLLRNVSVLKDRFYITVTSKLHGTSCRVGNLLINQEPKWWQRLFKYTPRPKYGMVVGSRRVVKHVEGVSNYDPGSSYYNVDVWTESSKLFNGKLEKGETVFYEIVGYLPGTTKPIMASQSNEKLSKFMDKGEFKTFIQTYGNTTTFSYGCRPGEFKVFVYRMTIQNEDGHVLDYSWEQVKDRCIKMNIPHVPEELPTTSIVIPPSNVPMFYDKSSNQIKGIVQYVQHLANSADSNFPAHIREGVVVRVDSYRFIPGFYKVKSYIFKVLEDIIRDNDINVDIEEEQSV